MKRRLLVTTAWAITGLFAELVASTALADDVRYYQEGGTTYRETHSTVRRPVTEMTMQPTTRTYYRDQTTTQLQDAYHTYYVPVTEYRRESYWQGRWNPFTQPTLAERWVTSTRWEMRVDRVQIPVAQRTLVPETRTEHVPVVTQALCRRPRRQPRAGGWAQFDGPGHLDRQRANDRGTKCGRSFAARYAPAQRAKRPTQQLECAEHGRLAAGTIDNRALIAAQRWNSRSVRRFASHRPDGVPRRCLRLGFVEIHSLVNVSKTSGDS